MRFANELRAWIEVRDGRIVDYGYSGTGHINVSAMRLGRKEISFSAAGLPDLPTVGPVVWTTLTLSIDSSGQAREALISSTPTSCTNLMAGCI